MLRQVTVTFTPYPEDADSDDATGLTATAFDRLMDALMEFGDDIEVEAVTPAPSTADLRLPTGRPGWLGSGQPYPCGTCGREVDDEAPHECVVPDGLTV